MIIDWNDPVAKRAYDKAYQQRRRDETPEKCLAEVHRYRKRHPRTLLDPAVRSQRHSEAAKRRWAKDVATRKRREVQIRDFIRGQKNRPCFDCKQWYPFWVMDFDHREPKEKKNNVSQCSSMAEAVQEILKCDLVCANCHRSRTHKNLFALLPNSTDYSI